MPIGKFSVSERQASYKTSPRFVKYKNNIAEFGKLYTVPLSAFRLEYQEIEDSV